MDSIIGTVAPLAIVGGVAAAAYVCMLNKKSNKGSKGSKKQVSKSTNDEEEEDIDTLFAKKPKKQAPEAPKIDFSKKKSPKAPKQAESPAPAPVVAPVPTPVPEPVQEQQVAPLSKKEKKAAAAAAAKKEEAAKKPEPAPKLSEVELLKLRIAELEGKSSTPKQEEVKKSEAPLSNRQAKRAAAAAASAAAAAPAPSPAPTPSPVAAPSKKDEKKKDEKKKEHNPAPQMSEEQKKEQEAALALFEKEHGQWREVTQYNGGKKKKAKDNFNYVDLAILTTQSTMTAKFGDRFILTQGENGSPLDQIFKTTGCKIELQQRPAKEVMDQSPNRGADLPMKIDLEGTDEQIKEARAIIIELITKGYSTLLSPDMSESKIRVDPTDHHQIIGKGGAYINKIMEATGAKIHIPRAAKDGEAADDIVRLVGSAEAVAQAKEAIRSLITNGFCDLTHTNWKKIQAPFPANYRRYLLQGGANSLIRAIQNNTTCKLVLPQSPADNTIAIIGPAHQVDVAEADIKAVLTKLELPVNDVFLVGFDSADFKSNELW